MDNPMTNPYASPSAEVIDESAGSIDALPRFSTWYVVLLSIVTFGIYTLYWLYSRVGKLNFAIENKVPMALIHGYLLLTVVSWFLQISGVLGSTLDEGTIGLLNGVISLVSFVLYYMVVYKMRNRICDELLKAPRWSGLLTFLLSMLYLNYKINEAHDNA
jgi:magnesium-transporting ATPase (P-type)